MTDTKRIMASTHFVDNGIKKDFVLTGFKKNGDTVGVWRPDEFAGVYLDEKNPKRLILGREPENSLWQMFPNEAQAQAILNAIGERKEWTVYYDEDGA